jgi:hypothetical protein
MHSMWFSHYTAIISLNTVNRLAVVMEAQRIPCEVRTEHLYVTSISGMESKQESHLLTGKEPRETVCVWPSIDTSWHLHWQSQLQSPPLSDFSEVLSNVRKVTIGGSCLLRILSFKTAVLAVVSVVDWGSIIQAGHVYLVLNCNLCTRYKWSVFLVQINDSFCGLVVRVSGYRTKGLVFDSRPYRTSEELGALERGPLSLVRTTDELLEWKNSGSCLENRD